MSLLQSLYNAALQHIDSLSQPQQLLAVVSAGIAARARHADIHLEPRFSDHAPLTIDYDFTL